MNTDGQSADQENKVLETAQDWLFDAFCQPRTIPDNWDLSEMSSPPKTNGSHPLAERLTQQQPELADQTEDNAGWVSLHNHYLDPFPEPRTYPLYWGMI